MSDIVERLRSVGTYRDNFPVHGTPEWCAQAAAEIERLRARLAAIEAQAEQSTEYVLALINKDLRDENERLRADIAEDGELLTELARKLAENKELRSTETAAWMICEPGCEYGPTFGTENAAWSALTKAPPGSELVELVRRGK